MVEILGHSPNKESQLTNCIGLCSKNETNKGPVEAPTAAASPRNYTDEAEKDVKRRRCDDR